MTEPSRTVGVVVVNYGGGPLTMECLHSLMASEWPAEGLRIVLVDNPVEGHASDGVAERVAAELPAVQVVRSPTNAGFAGGCNLGLTEVTITTQPDNLASRTVIQRNGGVCAGTWSHPTMDGGAKLERWVVQLAA